MWIHSEKEVLPGLTVAAGAINMAKTQYLQIYHGEARIYRRFLANRMVLQVNVPKTRRTYCKGKDCKKHTQHKVTQYKAGKVRNRVF